jgi:hypothetical protein
MLNPSGDRKQAVATRGSENVKSRNLAWIALVGLVVTAPLWAEEQAQGQSSSGDGVHLEGWGIRAGLSVDPDQALFGFHWDLGEIVEHLRLQPNVELGLGDDVVTVFGSVPVHYMFRVQSKFTPYAGGGIVVGVASYDRPNNDDTSFEAGARIIGGLQWPLNNGNPLAVEVNLGLGDVQDFEAKVAWTF